MILPLSKLNDPDFTPKAYTNLNDTQKMKDLVSEINEMKPSEQQVPMLQGLKAAREIITKNAKSRVTLHVLSDFREADWGGKKGEGLATELVEIVKNHNKDKDIKVRPTDMVHPPRMKNQAVPPPRDDSTCHTNVPTRYCASASFGRRSAARFAQSSACRHLPNL